MLLWIRSYWVSSRWTWWSYSAQWHMWLWRGEVMVSRNTFRSDPEKLARYRCSPLEYSENKPRPDYPVIQLLQSNGYDFRFNFLGFAYGVYERDIPPVFCFPIWSVALLASILPALAFRRRWRDRNRPPTACPKCGYDLRATPDRCPECGHVARKEAQ